MCCRYPFWRENDYLWFLHIDSQINKIEKEDLDRLQKKQLGYFRLSFDEKKNNINAKGANFRSKNFNLPFGDQSFLIHKNLFNLIGRFDENLIEGEDHKFIWNAKSLGIEIKQIARFQNPERRLRSAHVLSSSFGGGESR